MRFVVVTRNGEYVPVPEFRIHPGERGTRAFAGLPMSVDVDSTSFPALGEDGVTHLCQVTLFSSRGQSGVVRLSNRTMTPEEAAGVIAQADSRNFRVG